MSKMARNKGARGEREARDLLVSWLKPVYDQAGVDMPDLERNLMQSRQGGYDLTGLDWVALEVKRQENVQLPAWWRQTVKQAGQGQTPFLMWRQNRTPWRFRVRVSAAHCGYSGSYYHAPFDVDMSKDEAQRWMQTEVWYRLKG